MQRRAFLAATAASGARILRANDRIRGAVIGSGGRGTLLTGEFKEIGVEMAAVCDVYEPNLQAGLKAASTGAKTYRNYKQLLDDKSIDVVIVATPDHWHAQMVIDAVAAGKDVYLEKPMAHTIEETFRIVEAVRRSGRVVQVGTQRRSYDLFLEAKQVMESGALGDVRLVNSWWMNRQDAVRRTPLRGALDWRQWLGAAPAREPDPVRFFNWYWFWDYSGGMMVGQAAHVVDAIVWLMNSKFPSAVACSATRPVLPEIEVPETATMTIEFPENYLAVFSIAYQAMRYHRFGDQMKQFHGTKARFDVGRESYALYPEDPRALDLKPAKERRSPGTFDPATRAHIRNFLECVRSRSQPNATVEGAQYSTVILCMAMEALKTGRRLRWDAAARRTV